MGAASAFRQTDLTRVLRSVKSAGLRAHVWVSRDGSIHIEEANDKVLTPPTSAAPAGPEHEAEWDAALDE